MHTTINISPENPVYTVKLTDLYIKTGEPVKARIYLTSSKKLDIWNKYTSDILYLEKLLLNNETDVQDNTADNNTK